MCVLLLCHGGLRTSELVPASPLTSLSQLSIPKPAGLSKCKCDHVSVGGSPSRLGLKSCLSPDIPSFTASIQPSPDLSLSPLWLPFFFPRRLHGQFLLKPRPLPQTWLHACFFFISPQPGPFSSQPFTDPLPDLRGPGG